MSLTSDFILASGDFASRYVVLVEERACSKQKPMKVGQVLQYPADNMIFAFSFERVGNVGQFSQNMVSCQIADLPAGDRTKIPKCYLLPFERDEVTQMRLGNKADFFFTSTLCGCTVQVDGPRTTPRVAHANAGQLYGDTYANSKAASTLKGADKIHAQAEAMANTAAQANMQAKLPIPGAGLVGTVTKADYLAHYTKHNLKAAKHVFKTEADYRVSKLNPTTSMGGLKPAIGAFVFGRKNARDEWTFYYQSNIDVNGTLKRTRGGSGKKEIQYEGVVLGPVRQFYP